jgi:hypothetical protein
MLFNFMPGALFGGGLLIAQSVAGTDPIPRSAVEEVLREFRVLIFGSGHVTRDTAFDAYGKVPGREPNLAELIEARHARSSFLIWAHMPGWMTSEVDPRLAGWMKPTLARLQGTWLGASAVGPPGQSPTLEQLADSLLYLGPTESLTTSIPSQSVYRDATYLRALLRRDQIEGGSNATELARLRQKYLKDYSYPRGFAPQTPLHALSRAAPRARSGRVARSQLLARTLERAAG